MFIYSAVVCVAADNSCARFLLVLPVFLFHFKMLTVMLECPREETLGPRCLLPLTPVRFRHKCEQGSFFGLIKMLIVSCCNILAEKKGEGNVSSYTLWRFLQIIVVYLVLSSITGKLGVLRDNQWNWKMLELRTGTPKRREFWAVFIGNCERVLLEWRSWLSGI